MAIVYDQDRKITIDEGTGYCLRSAGGHPQDNNVFFDLYNDSTFFRIEARVSFHKKAEGHYDYKYTVDRTFPEQEFDKILEMFRDHIGVWKANSQNQLQYQVSVVAKDS